jgi:hypothetical protein
MHVPADSSLATPTVVVIVTLDGVRRQEIFEGARLPNLTALRAASATMGCGSPFLASGPDYVSLPGYMEMLTGLRRHGCYSNDCSPPKHDTLADDFARRASKLGDVAVFASWPPLGSRVTRSSKVLVSAGRDGTNHPELLTYDAEARAAFERGERASPSPGYENYRPDRYTAAIATRYLRTRAPRFLFLSLGDTDEHAHRDDYAGHLEALRFADGIIGEIDETLHALRKRGIRTLLIVTTDHGRARTFVEHGRKHPESASVWLMASGNDVRARGCIVTDGARYLADIAPTVRAVAGFPQVPAPAAGRALVELFESP